MPGPGRAAVPGEYHAYAFPTDITPDRRDPDALKTLKQYGKPVTFTEEKSTLSSLRQHRWSKFQPLACNSGFLVNNLLVFPAL